MKHATEAFPNMARVENRLGGFVGTPEDVVRHPGLTPSDKRAILSDWASDAHAVDNMPALRQLDDGSIVSVDAILDALRSLDDPGGQDMVQGQEEKTPSRRSRFLPHLRFTRRRRDDDDDPPPCPASAAIPVRIRVADALAAA